MCACAHACACVCRHLRGGGGVEEWSSSKVTELLSEKQSAELTSNCASRRLMEKRADSVLFLLAVSFEIL